jgi:hypothetical protein
MGRTIELHILPQYLRDRLVLLSACCRKLLAHLALKLDAESSSERA